MSKTARATITIVNRLGFHARPAMAFVELASSYSSKVTLRRGEKVVDGKSVFAIMELGATRGTELEVLAEGDDARETVADLVSLVGRGFDEE